VFAPRGTENVRLEIPILSSLCQLRLTFSNARPHRRRAKAGIQPRTSFVNSLFHFSHLCRACLRHNFRTNLRKSGRETDACGTPRCDSCTSLDQAGKLKAQVHGNASTNLGKTGHKLHYHGAELNMLPG
jgi:hypothetical protein